MEPLSVATAVLAVITPYLTKAGDGVLEELGKQGLAKAQAVFQALTARWHNKPKALQRLKAYAGDPVLGREGLLAALRTEIDDDDDFAAALKALLEGLLQPEAFIRQQVGQHGEALAADILNFRGGSLDVEQVGADNAKLIGIRVDNFGGH
ncbi:hypothetical protein [Hydrogenophaga luteola]|uniref:DUF937 domain-containing protein n=1 Tax=Hydrogenophaga luteola TaxID=1591122 RepID=A0ABV7W782_9BURK